MLVTSARRSEQLIPYTLWVPDRIKHSAAEQGEAVTAFADRLFDGPLP